MRVLIAAAAILAAGALLDGAKADPYAWCAQYGGQTGGTNCYFVTLAQCQATVAGAAAPNPEGREVQQHGSGDADDQQPPGDGRTDPVRGVIGRQRDQVRDAHADIGVDRNPMQVRARLVRRYA